jgi:hypothetical protein
MLPNFRNQTLDPFARRRLVYIGPVVIGGAAVGDDRLQAGRLAQIQSARGHETGKRKATLFDALQDSRVVRRRIPRHDRKEIRRCE